MSRDRLSHFGEQRNEASEQAQKSAKKAYMRVCACVCVRGAGTASMYAILSVYSMSLRFFLMFFFLLVVAVPMHVPLVV